MMDFNEFCEKASNLYGWNVDEDTVIEDFEFIKELVDTIDAYHLNDLSDRLEREICDYLSIYCEVLNIDTSFWSTAPIYEFIEKMENIIE